ncbi:MAG TPA: 50S ribosomal protein L22 [Candidatus Limnocylindria bacterium]
MTMEVRASAKFQRFSPRKARLVTDLITGKSAEEAISMLENLPKGAALPIGRVVRSAVANAENKENAPDVDELVVSKIYVNDGPREKRVQPAPMGRAYQVQKRKSHVTVHVSDEVKAVNERSGGKGRARAARSK